MVRSLVFFLVHFCLLFFTPASNAQWNPVQIGFQYVEQGTFVTDQLAFVVGNSGLTGNPDGYVARSTDGAQSFQIIWEVIDGDYSAVHFLNSQVGFVAGDHQANAVVLKTINGGNSWTTIPVQAYIPSFQDFWFINDQLGFLCGGFGENLLFRTQDGGNTWARVGTPSGGGLYDIHFLDDMNGYMCSDDGKVLISNDQGNTWFVLQGLPLTSGLETIQFLSKTVGLIGYKNGKVYRTSNAGQSWSLINLPGDDSPVYMRMHFINHVNGFLLCYDNDERVLYQTVNAGSSWQKIHSVNALFFWDFICFNPSQTRALLGGFNNLYLNATASTLVTPSLPFAFLSNSQSYCTGQPEINLRVDLGGIPPWDLILHSTSDVTINDIPSTPYFHPVSPGTTTTYTISNVTDGQGATNPGVGTAVITVNPLSSAVLSGIDTVCVGEKASLYVKFTGCPPWSITVSDGYNTYTENNITSPSHFFQVPLQKDSINLVTISIVSVTDGAGQLSQNVSGTAKIYSHETSVDVYDQSEDNICIQEQGSIFMRFTGKGPYCVKYTDGTNQYEKCGINVKDYELIVPPITGEYEITEVSNECGTGRILRSTAEFTLETIVNSPENLDVTLDNDKRTVHLQWDDLATNEYRYYIHRKTEDDPVYRVLTYIDNNLENFTDYSAHDNQKNWYKVRADGPDNCPAYSNEDSVYLTPNFSPVKANATAGQFQSTGTAWADLNNDDKPDLIVSYLGVFINQGNGQFKALNPGDTVVANMLTGGFFAVADYDNDGDVDVYSLPINYFHPSRKGIYKNNGDNTFTRLELPDFPAPTLAPKSVNWGDVDNDMDLDLLISGDPILYYRNDGNDVFTLNPDIGLPTTSLTKDNSFVDFDNDGDLDFCSLSGSVSLFQNDGNGHFTLWTGHDITFSYSPETHSWTDINHDALPDLVICLQASAPAGCITWLNLGSGKFRKVVNAGFNQHGSVSSAAGDFNNDGRNDIFVACSATNPLYYSITDTTYVGSYNNPLNFDDAASNGTGAADSNGDGYLDIAIKSTYSSAEKSYVIVYQNAKKYEGNWIKIKCIGTISNHSAIGARLYLKARIQNKAILQFHQIDTESGSRGQSDLVQHFGLGDATIVDSLVILWPSGMKTTHTSLEVNKFHIIREDGAIPPLSTPSNLQAKTYSYKRIDLTWQDISSDEYGFILERSLQPNSGFIVLDTLASNSKNFQDTTVSANTDYYYRISMYNYFGRSGFSNVAHALTYLMCSLVAEIDGADSLSLTTGQYVTLYATPGQGNTYQWLFNGILLPDTTSSILTGRQGLYYVVVETPEHCVDTSETVLIQLNALLVYNPTSTLVTAGGASKSIGWLDFNRDGYDDVFITNVGNNVLLENDKNGSFTKKSNSGLDRLSGEYFSAAWADFNNDSWLDVCITDKIGPSYVYKNNQDGTFTPILLDLDSVSLLAATWADANNDGYIDLLGVSYGHGWLYVNVHGENFIRLDIPEIDNITHDNRSATWFDFDNDDFPDIILSDNSGGFGNEVYRNKGNLEFKEVLQGQLSTLGSSHSTNIVDYDNDGDFDIFESSDIPTAGTNLYRNTGNGIFETVTGNLLTDYEFRSIGSNWADYDNDGWIDVFLGGDKQLLFRNIGGNAFDIMSEEIKFSPTQYQRDQAVAWGDIENDGFPDLAVARDRLTNNGVLSNLLFENTPNGNHWIKITPIGNGSNYFSIGSKIKVVATIRGQQMTQSRIISAPSGGTWSAQNSMKASFGLGDATQIDSLIVEWPCGGKVIQINVAADQTLEVLQPYMGVMGSRFIQLCSGESYQGQTIDSITIHKDTFHLTGYDSVAITHLIPVEAKKNYQTIAIQTGDQFHGITILADTVLIDTFSTAFGCDSLEVFQILASMMTSVNPVLEDQIQFEVKPNPAKENITLSCVSCSMDSYQVSISNAVGQKCHYALTRLNDNAVIMDLTSINPGIYFVNISSPGGQHVRRFLKIE